MADHVHDPDFVALCEAARARIREVSVDESRAAQEAAHPALLIDVREDHEWAVDRCEGALHLGRGILERDIRQTVPDKGAPIILYCGGGYRSALAAANLQAMGYRDVRSMAGGIRAWRAAGLPLEVGAGG
jgi:rhodanese-related sulfurtransferase